MADRLAPISVEYAPRALPAGAPQSPPPLHPFSRAGLAFINELFRERRISSVEWMAIRQAIAPFHEETLAPLVEIRLINPASSNSRAG